MPGSLDHSPARCWLPWPCCPVACPSFDGSGPQTQDHSSLEHCSYKTPSQGLSYSSPARPESVLFNWVALIVVWLYERDSFLFHGAKQEEMLRALFTPPWESVAGWGDSIPHQVAAQRWAGCRHSPSGRSFTPCCGGLLSRGHFPRWKGQLCTVDLLRIPGHTRETVSR